MAAKLGVFTLAKIAYGENGRLSDSGTCVGGTSPHAWGKLFCVPQSHSDQLVHPHTRGENQELAKLDLNRTGLCGHVKCGYSR